MSVTLPNVERLTSAELAHYKAAIQTEEAARDKAEAEAKRFLKGSTARLQDMVSRLNAGSEQPALAGNGNGQHKAKQEIRPAVKAKRRTGKAPIRYRNPADPTQVWSGHGKQPRWMGGQPKEQFRIGA